MAAQSPSALTRFGIFMLIVGCVLVLVMLGLLRHLDERATAGTAASKDRPRTLGATSPAVVAAPTAQQRALAELTQNIRLALAVLRDPNNPNKAQALAALRQALDSADPKVAIAAIRLFLATHEDATTGLRFKVGEGGELAEAPSLRTFLMDDLGTIARGIGAPDAADAAKETLADKTSADEWAVAMRNLAWADPGGSKALLAQKARELINYAPWQQSPTGGYFEAFDAAAYSGDASLIADLAPLAQNPSAEQRPALIALERLSALSPGDVASYLNDHPNVLAERPLLRADYMGNVDLSDPGQLAQAETYLQRADVSEAEKDKFLARLGTPAGFVSNNLLTPPETMTMSLPDHQALVNATASTWLASGKYPTLQGALQTVIAETQPASH